MIKIFLRIAIATGFLSAVADRFGFWNKEVSAWGNWLNILLKQRKLKEVIAVLAKAIEKNPRNIQFLNAQVKFSSKFGDFSNLIKAYQAIIKLQPKESNTINNFVMSKYKIT